MSMKNCSSSSLTINNEEYQIKIIQISTMCETESAHVKFCLENDWGKIIIYDISIRENKIEKR